MQYGYARVSGNEQETSLQLDAFRRAGVGNVVQEKRSAIKKRPMLEALLVSLEPGDELVVWKVDRVARSIRHLSALLDQVKDRGAGFRSLTEPFDTANPAGRMMVQMLGVIAEFEWCLIRERSIAGQIAAVERGVKLGRRRKLSAAQEAACYRKWAGGRYTMAALAADYGVDLSCIKRVIYRVERPDASCVALRLVPSCAGRGEATSVKAKHALQHRLRGE